MRKTSILAWLSHNKGAYTFTQNKCNLSVVPNDAPTYFLVLCCRSNSHFVETMPQMSANTVVHDKKHQLKKIGMKARYFELIHKSMDGDSGKAVLRIYNMNRTNRIVMKE